jgi:hypothetical protein
MTRGGGDMEIRRTMFFGLGLALALTVYLVANLSGTGDMQSNAAFPQHDIPAFATPCGGSESSLEAVQETAPYEVMLPHSEMAHPDNLQTVWDCPADGILLEFGSGVTVFYDVSTIADPERGWDALARERSGIYSTARVRGVPASLTDPAKDETKSAAGGVTLVQNGLYISVGGDGSIPLGKLVAAAESLRGPSR